MFSEPLGATRSQIQRFDPRLRVVSATLYSSVVAVLTNINALLVALFVSAALVATARLPLRAVLKRLSVVFGFLVFLWLLLPVTFGGAALFSIGPLVLHRDGVLLALQISLKSFSILAAFSALIATMDTTTLGHSLIRLHLPPKIVYLLLVTYRYIFVIEQEFKRLQRAAKTRGFKGGTNLHSYRTYAYLVGMLFVRAANRAQRVHQAMKCRGFKGRFYCLSEFKATAFSWAFATLMALVSAALVCLEVRAISL